MQDHAHGTRRAGQTLAALALCLGLAGCAQPTLNPACPALAKYSPKERQKLAARLAAHPEMKEAPIFIMDDATEEDERGETCTP